MLGSHLLRWSRLMSSLERNGSGLAQTTTAPPRWQASRFNAKEPGKASGLARLQDAHVQQGGESEATTFSRRANQPGPGMFDAFVKTCQRWRLEEPEQATLLGYKSHEFLGQMLLRGYVPPRTQDVRDRIGYVMAITLGLGTLFDENVDAEISWLQTEHPLLKEPPLAFMLRGRMINLITVADIVRAERAL
jgi:hypothetical protein